MVRVLIPGKYYCVTCPHCNAVLRYEKEDMKQTLIPVNQHLSHKINTYIECPQCDTQIILEGVKM